MKNTNLNSTQLRIGVISTRNLINCSASTHYYAFDALCRTGVHISHLGALPWWRYFMNRVLTFNSKVGKSNVLHRYIKAVRRSLLRDPPNVVLGLHCSTIFPHCPTKLPFAYMTDATAHQMRNYYASHSNLSEQEFSKLEEYEIQAIGSAKAIIVPSQWVADSILSQYHADPSCVHVVEWGANIKSQPTKQNNRPLVEVATSPRLLLGGFDWHRKGGDIAVEATKLLNEQGIHAVLTIIGACVAEEYRCDFVKVVGKLNRFDTQQNNEFDAIFQNSDIYLHPARAECYGHIICEALAYGIPVVATDTGGIPQIVQNGINGMLLAPEATPLEFANCIKDLVIDSQRLRVMQSNALREFRARLNWDVWAERTLEILNRLLT